MEFESSITKITLRYQNNFIQVFTSYRITYCITLPYHLLYHATVSLTVSSTVSFAVSRNRITTVSHNRIIYRIINHITYYITQPYHILYHTTVSLTVSSTVSFTVSSTVSRNRITYGPFTPCINLNI